MEEEWTYIIKEQKVLQHKAETLNLLEILQPINQSYIEQKEERGKTCYRLESI